MNNKKVLILYKIISYFNLIIAGIFFLIFLTSLMVVPQRLLILLYMMLMGSVIMLSYLSFPLQRSMADKEYILPERTRSGLRINAYITLAYAIFQFSGLLGILLKKNEILKNLPPEYAGMGTGVINFMLIFLLVFVITLIIHIFLTLFFLRKVN